VRILQLLIESEIGRLSVWCNPTNEQNRPGTAPVSATNLERGVTHEEWPKIIQQAWKLSPGMTIYMAERFKYAPVETEVTRLVSSEPRKVLDVPEALRFLLGERLDSTAKSTLKVTPVFSSFGPSDMFSGYLFGLLCHPWLLLSISNLDTTITH